MPPECLLETALAKLPKVARIPLSNVIQVLAFKHGKLPRFRKGTSATDAKRASKQQQAARALFAAAREGSVKLCGTHCSDRKSGPIEPHEFDVELQLDSDDNAICPNLAAGTIRDFVDLREKHSVAHSWRNVTVERTSLLRWITGVTRRTQTAGTVSKSVRFMAAELQANNNLTREEALQKCRKKYPELSARSFQSTVWPEARDAAGLSRKAPAGRKPKLMHRKS
jgi:hypothetical protein